MKNILLLIFLCFSCDAFPGSAEYAMPLRGGVLVIRGEQSLPPGVWPVEAHRLSYTLVPYGEAIDEYSPNPVFKHANPTVPHALVLNVVGDTVLYLSQATPVPMMNHTNVYYKKGHPDMDIFTGVIPVVDQRTLSWNSIGFSLIGGESYQYGNQPSYGVRKRYWCEYLEPFWNCDFYESAIMDKNKFECYRIVSETGKFADAYPVTVDCNPSLEISVGVTIAGSPNRFHDEDHIFGLPLYGDIPTE